MPHADASNFSTQTKSEGYESILTSLHSLILDSPPNRNWISACANTSSLLWHMYHSLPTTEPAYSVNWSGFYVLDPKKANQLILGPFMGKVACQTIPFENGVCGSVARTGEAEVVVDVEKRPGHVACDGETKSEVVVPIKLKGEKVVGVIDIDCAELNGFNDQDRKYLERIAKLLGDECEW